jgi:hypothetical protein
LDALRRCESFSEAAWQRLLAGLVDVSSPARQNRRLRSLQVECACVAAVRHVQRGRFDDALDALTYCNTDADEILPRDRRYAKLLLATLKYVEGGDCALLRRVALTSVHDDSAMLANAQRLRTHAEAALADWERYASVNVGEVHALRNVLVAIRQASRAYKMSATGGPARHAVAYAADLFELEPSDDLAFTLLFDFYNRWPASQQDVQLRWAFAQLRSPAALADADNVTLSPSVYARFVCIHAVLRRLDAEHRSVAGEAARGLWAMLKRLLVAHKPFGGNDSANIELAAANPMRALHPNIVASMPRCAWDAHRLQCWTRSHLTQATFALADEPLRETMWHCATLMHCQHIASPVWMRWCDDLVRQRRREQRNASGGHGSDSESSDDDGDSSDDDDDHSDDDDSDSGDDDSDDFDNEQRSEQRRQQTTALQQRDFEHEELGKIR